MVVVVVWVNAIHWHVDVDLENSQQRYPFDNLLDNRWEHNVGQSPRSCRNYLVAGPNDFQACRQLRCVLFAGCFDAAPAPGAHVPPGSTLSALVSRVQESGDEGEKHDDKPSASFEELRRLRVATRLATSGVHHGVSGFALGTERPLARYSTLCLDIFPSVTVPVLALAFVDLAGVTIEAKIPGFELQRCQRGPVDARRSLWARTPAS